MEEARHFEKWDQTLTLLWFEDEEVPPPKRGTGRDPEIEEDEDVLLKELDGALSWPTGKRRRR